MHILNTNIFKFINVLQCEKVQMLLPHTYVCMYLYVNMYMIMCISISIIICV